MSPERTPTPADLLVDEKVGKAIGKALRDNGMARQDIEDGRQDVYVKVLVAMKRGAAPANLDEMIALSTLIAERHAIDALRKAAVRARDLVEGCDPDELAPLGPPIPRRDPVDTGRQLEVLAQLFREDEMPPGGVDILEGVACKCTHEEIAQDLGIEPSLVKWRMHQMRKVYRRRMEKLGLLPNVTPLFVLVSTPGVVDVLRTVA